MPQTTLEWVLVSTLGFILTLLGFLSKTVVAQVLKRLDSIINELQNLTKVTLLQEGQIASLNNSSVVQASKIEAHTAILNNHSERLIRLEVTNENEN